MARLCEDAICLREAEWSETSQTVTLLTREHGLLRGLAKGSRRGRAEFSGGFEPLTRGELLALVRPAGQLTLLTSWDLRETFPQVRASLAVFHAAMYMADVVLHTMTEGNPHPRVFDALAGSLRELGPGPARAAALASFQWSVLDDTGHRPELHEDIRGRAPLRGAPSHTFMPDLGGFTEDTGPGGPGYRVRAETLVLLRKLEAGAALHELADQDPSTLERAARLLAVAVRHTAGREPPSLGFVFAETAV
ncbi:MAG: DNA repair protein RecO [Phycisphaerales bacterium]|nr:DNA repair protein RecO [Phycisphaerales bacterium]